MSILLLEGISKTYRDGTEALRSMRLAVETGEIITIVGPSGCGKTTLLRLIAGLDTPTSGHIWLKGRNITNLPAEKRGMGVVFQNYALFPHLNVADNIAFGLRVRGIGHAKRQRKVQHILEQLHITDLATRWPDQLSGGQQQRVALGRALAIEPDLLLLDEPLTALDAQLRTALRLDLRRTLDEIGITSLYVTHDQAEALSLGDRVIVLNEGRTEQIGTPQEIYQRPASRFVAQFIGITNRLVGHLRRTPAGLCIEVCDTIYIPLDSVRLERLIEGRPLEVLVRPEDIEVCSIDTGQMQGAIQQMQFLGDRLRLQIQAPGAPDGITVDVDARLNLTIGNQVGLIIKRVIPLPHTSFTNDEPDELLEQLLSQSLLASMRPSSSRI